MKYLFNNGIIKIHLKSRQGVYGVFSIGKDTITCQTKHYSFRTPKSDFKCFAGEYKPSEKQANYFKALLSESNLQKQLDVVKYKLQNELIQLKKDEADMKHQVNNYYDNLEKRLEVLRNKLVIQKKEYEKEMEEKMQEKIVNSDEMRKYKFKKAVEIYQHPIDLSNFENHKGIKFIIQKVRNRRVIINHSIVEEHRIFFDPFQFVANFHSSLDEITETIRGKTNGDSWWTINGGWLKVIGDVVILYGRSGDYGVYDDNTAIECAKKLFPGKQVYSYADCVYDSGMNEGKPEKLRGFYNGNEFTDKKFLNSSFKLGEKFDNFFDIEPIKKYHVPKRGVTEDNKSFLEDYKYGDDYITFVDGQPCFIEDNNSYYTFNFYDPKDLK